MISSEAEQITYTLSMPEPSNHLFEVKIEFENIKEEHVDLILPVWRPGRYLIFDFSSGVIEFNAHDKASNPLKWKKFDKSAWRIETGSIPGFSASYKVFANEFSLRTRGLDEEHGFVNGTAVFMYSEKYRNYPLMLKVIPYNEWHVTTGLDIVRDDINTFYSPDYDSLADTPLEIGNQKDHTFNLDDKEYVFSFFGNAEYNIDKVISDLKEIIKVETDFWEKIPYKKYVFIVHCTNQGSGGTEHINSTVLDVTPKSFENEKSYKGFLKLVSHEFFHAWNVKQLRPAGLTPYDYTKENYTEELWVAEGSTSYYDGLMVLRSGLTDTEDFFNEIARAAEEERRRPGNRVQSLAESSFDAWVKFWKATPQRYDMESDYYSKGADVSMILDLHLRHISENKSSLDDVFRMMLNRFPPVKGYTNEDLMNTCNELTGFSFKQFFDDYVYGTKPIEWEKYIGFAGLEIVSVENLPPPIVGLELLHAGGRVLAENIIPNSAAESAKLMQGDEIISADGDRISFDNITQRLMSMSAGDEIKLGIFREDKYKEVKLSLVKPKEPNYSVVKISAPDPLQKKIYEDWLKVQW